MHIRTQMNIIKDQRTLLAQVFIKKFTDGDGGGRKTIQIQIDFEEKREAKFIPIDIFPSGQQ
jgi:hypothetical protein